MIEINSKEEMKKYFAEEDNSYVFNDNVKFKIHIETTNSIKAFNIIAKNIKAKNIDACNIDAWDIIAKNIDTWDINALNIDACDINTWNIIAKNIDVCNIDANDIIVTNIKAFNISYYAVCIARHSFECKSVKGRRENSIHKCLDSEIKYKVDEE